MTRPLRSTDPSHIGDYELIGRIGGGGMGDVFLGRSPGGRLAAVKVVRDLLADDPRFRERFRREVAAARSVSGAYTAAVLDADPGAERPWLATAYIDGPSLLDRVAQDGPLSAPETRRLGAGLAEALRDLHRAGLVHRDLKPGNVLLAADGPRLIDFGIIRAEDGEGLTETGYVLGSAGFMAPEQASGGEATAAADVYALGAVLTFASTGHGPFGSGATPSVLLRQAAGDRDISAVPEGLRDIVARCLDILPGARPTTDALLELLGGNAIEDAVQFDDTLKATEPATDRMPTGKGVKRSARTKASTKPRPKPRTKSRELDDLLLAASSGTQNTEIATTPTTLMRAEPDKGKKNSKGAKKSERARPQPPARPQPIPTRRKFLFFGMAGAAAAAFGVGLAKMPHGDAKTTGAENKDTGSTTTTGLPTTKTTGVLGGPLRDADWTGKVAGRADLLALSGSTLLVHGLGLTAFTTASGSRRWDVGSGTFTELNDGALPATTDTVYEAAYGTGDMVAVSVATGTEAWRVPAPAAWLPRGLVGASADVAVGWSYTDSGSSGKSTAEGLWAVDAHLRRQLWDIPIGHIDGAPHYNAGTDQVLVSQPDDYQLTAYDAKTGAQAWTAKDTSVRTGDAAFATAITGRGTAVYWATNRLYAFDEHGQPLWRVGVSEGEGSLFHAVIADDDAVYAASDGSMDNGMIAAYKASDGAPLWRVAWPKSVGFLNPSLECEMALGAGNLYIVDRLSGSLVAVDTKTGETRWQYHDPSADKNDFWHVVADDRYVFIGYGTTVRGFKAS